LAVPHDLLDAIRDPEKQAEQAGQTTQAKIDQDNDLFDSKTQIVKIRLIQITI
jgi:hypothetical protein